MRSLAILPLAALLLTSACAYDYAGGYAPDYPPGYDSGMGSGLVTQPGDRFGGQNVASVAVFDAPLAPFGQWVDSRFGRAFRPDVGPDWRPYVNGRWGENRLWISDDPWGWATDHYGRWGFDERAGWVWTPGTEWAPSWVAWREDEGQNVAGWAPIPPGVNYSVNLGFGTGWGYDNFNSWYAPSWVWVPRSYLYQPGFGGRVLPWRYGASYWGDSRWQYQPGYAGRPNWQGNPGRGGPGYGNGGYGNGQGYGRGSWQGQRGNPGNAVRPARGPRPGQSAVPDQNGFVAYQTTPRSDPGPQSGAVAGVRPDRASAAPRPQRAERPAPQQQRAEAPRSESPRRSAANDEGPIRPQ
jgi:hypothetical protein